MTAFEQGWSLDNMPSEAALNVPKLNRDSPPDLIAAARELTRSHLDLVQPLFDEAVQDSETIKYKNGEHVDELAAITTVTKAEFDQIEEGLDPEYLYPRGYRNVGDKKQWLSRDLENKIYDIQFKREQRLAEAGHKWNATARDVLLPPGLLDVPPYRRQDDSERSSDYATVGCVGACFRMCYQAITGVALDETAVGRAAQSEITTDYHAVPDDLYLKVLRSQGLQRMSQAKVTPITLGGTDFSEVASLTSRLKAAKPSVEVYAMASLGSEKNIGIWHSNMLLAADSDTVVVHDPTDMRHGAAYRRLERDQFYARWAMALNKLHLIVVDRPS